MQAVIVKDDQVMAWSKVEKPTAGRGEVLIRVHATAINRADLMQRRGFYPPPPGASAIMGLECAGEIAALGAGVTRWQIGDRVCALLSGGGYAEYAVAPEGSVLPVPAGLDFVQAAALPEVFATAWLNLFMEAGLQVGEKVILHAGASGVGTAAVQLCQVFGNPCFVTAGSADKVAACLALGASAGSNRKTEAFFAKASAFAGPAGIDVILDPVGGAYLQDNLKLLGMNGRLVLIGLMGGSKAEIELGLLLMKRLRVIGSTLRARPVAEKAAVMAELQARVWPAIERGDIKPIVDQVFGIEDVNAAHDLVASDQTFGKVVLSVSPS
ncbi:MAG: NAD(P)H-quinone oxidoreductase [Pseudomonadales bacterium]|jgi:putative PIG3 family NAD(P)H quinone oxidoreductase|nr:NAD(P)H-quinone oxidoreductase [Pseudomonadales bacterium]MDP4641302.1 NAD(P)H-quinone oxidoreductase [Pseudomonadales bacterium]MDP4764960.1 NAD(P)H-quinone oxidoreductase [Pseudomonadales bacterium]MDP4876249.1 NAD(P)H-quinone oxidoreductase [Pseudomonadales bacterium]MDP4911185.1 NAD(P)H-quinone oxidoreductase [Pseudomonadales bacterium]